MCINGGKKPDQPFIIKQITSFSLHYKINLVNINKFEGTVDNTLFINYKVVKKPPLNNRFMFRAPKLSLHLGLNVVIEIL
jgi:hypothetical protein